MLTVRLKSFTGQFTIRRQMYINFIDMNSIYYNEYCSKIFAHIQSKAVYFSMCQCFDVCVFNTLCQFKLNLLIQWLKVIIPLKMYFRQFILPRQQSTLQRNISHTRVHICMFVKMDIIELYDGHYRLVKIKTKVWLFFPLLHHFFIFSKT